MKKLICFFIITLFSISAFSLDIQSKEIDINGNKIHYYQINNENNKPNLIMLTGIGTTANFWPKDFIETLSSEYNLYLLDYRGINVKQDSSNTNYSIANLANDTNAFVEKLKLKSLYILGWSMGSMVALQTVFDNPNSYEYVYLISPPLPTQSKDNAAKFKKAPKFKNDDDIYNYVFHNNLYKYSPKKLNYEKDRFINPDINTLFPSKAIYAKQKIARNKWISNKSSIKSFINIQTPTIVFLSKNDQIEHIKNIQKSISKVKDKSSISTIYLNNSGHAIDWDYPNKLANIINALS